ncbi:MAG: NAD-glutamate dehydrogenase, partial [Halorhodospira sp.]
MSDYHEGQLAGHDPRLRLAALVERRWPSPQAVELRAFLERYYAGVAAEDLAGRSPESLYAAALAHWRLAAHRPAGTPAVYVYNPDAEQHGWESSHTVIDLVDDDRSFLIDSVTMALQELGLGIHCLIHPVLPVRREDGWVALDPGPSGQRTAFMHFEVDRRSSAEQQAALRERLLRVLADVATVVDDWQPMREQLLAVAEELLARPPAGVTADTLKESDAFLRWAAAHHFTFLGYRAYRLQAPGQDQGATLTPEPETALGLLRSAPAGPSVRFAALPEAVRRRALDPEPLILTQTNARAPVHRPGAMDYVGVKRFDDQGRVVGEHRFLGLYTSAAYYRSAQEIPLLRRKVAAVLERAGHPRDSHAGKALLNILETYPRDELFQIETDELERIVHTVLHLRERPRTRLLVRYDTWQRFAACLVYVPRERYDTHNRQRIQRCLEQAFGAADSDFSVQLGESPLARIRFMIRLPEPGLPALDTHALEQRLVAILRSWQDAAHEALLETFGEERGTQLAQRYADAFPAAYREAVSPRVAAHDVARMEQLPTGGGPQMALYRPLEAADGELRFKLFHGEYPVALSDILPVLEHMGLRVIEEQPFEVIPQGGARCWIHDFGLCWEGGGGVDPAAVGDGFREAFAAVWARRAESDGLNRLVLGARLNWREVALLRAYVHYLHQLGSAFSQAYMAETLAAHAGIAAELVGLFHARFDPERADSERAASCIGTIREALQAVASLDEDRILRRLLAS